MFEIISCSVRYPQTPTCDSDILQNHLLLDDLTGICSTYIIQFVDLRNVSSILVDAQHFNALALVECLHGYMTRNLETLMEMHALDDLPQDVLKSFSVFLRGKQMDHYPYTRHGAGIPSLEQKWASWLTLQDIPVPFAPTYFLSSKRPNPVPISHPMSSHGAAVAVPLSPGTPHHPTPARGDHQRGGDDIFPMDGDVFAGGSPVPTMPVGNPQINPPTVIRGWKSPIFSHRIDMKALMEAEKQASQTKHQLASGSSPPSHAPSKKWTIRSQKEQPSDAARDQPMKSVNKSPSSQKTSLSTMEIPSSSPLRPSSLKKYQIRAGGANILTHRPSVTSSQTDGAISSSPVTHPVSTKASHGALNVAMQSGNKVKLDSSLPLGPLIVPVKSPAVTNLPARRSVSGCVFTNSLSLYFNTEVLSRNSPAWSSHQPTLPIPQVAAQGPSFAAIQEQQAAKPPVYAPPKSLKEIQDEEQEIAFLNWFEAESEKLRKQEEDALVSSISGGQSTTYTGQGNRVGHARRGRGDRERGKRRGRRQRDGDGQEPH